jgi:hypothetical protein
MGKNVATKKGVELGPFMQSTQGATNFSGSLSLSLSLSHTHTHTHTHVMTEAPVFSVVLAQLLCIDKFCCEDKG